MPRVNCAASHAGLYTKVYRHSAWTYDATQKQWRFDESAVMRKVNTATMMTMLAKGTAVLEFGQAAAVHGCRVHARTIKRLQLEPIGVWMTAAPEKVSQSRNSPTMLTFGETLANAGAHKDDGFCHRTGIKVKLWPIIDFGRMRCPTVRPAMTAKQLAEAASLMGYTKEQKELAHRVFIQKQPVPFSQIAAAFA